MEFDVDLDDKVPKEINRKEKERVNVYDGYFKNNELV